MADRTFDQIFKTVIVALATAALSGIGYLTLVVIKTPDLETKFEKQDELINDVKVFPFKQIYFFFQFFSLYCGVVHFC